jgi:diguanylate cyclase (GGDEF)-like protein
MTVTAIRRRQQRRANMPAALRYHQERRAHARTKAREAALTRALLTDPLTGIRNRAGLELTWMGRRPSAVLLLDLDGFKPVNDTLGHAAGDEVLRVVAARLAGLPGCRAARLGGDEFALLVDDAVSVVDRAAWIGGAGGAPIDLAAEIGQPVPLEGSVMVRVGASVGVRPVVGDDDLAVVLREADQAMYTAKRTGAGVHLFGAADSDQPTRLEREGTAHVEG